MAKKESGIGLSIFFAVLIAIGFFSSPNIVPVRQTEYSECPSQISEIYRLLFYNDGTASGALTVSVSSDDMDFLIDSDTMTLIKDNDPTAFKFKINTSTISESETVSISYEAKYTKVIIPIRLNNTCEYDSHRTLIR